MYNKKAKDSIVKIINNYKTLTNFVPQPQKSIEPKKETWTPPTPAKRD